jgi:endonuclease/exonuclease/phosphatase family metal-dependent hydrolase
MKRIACLVLLVVSSIARAEEFTVATYNVEVFDHHFMAHKASTQPIAKDPAAKDILDELRKKNDEDNWETAQVILDPKFSPDILVIEEGCDESDLLFFNKRWLNEAYATVITFPTNTERHQNLNLLMKKGFKILETKDDYYKEPDPVGNSRGSRLFARGPAFVKVQTPGGYVFWVGVTHMKSKNVGADTFSAAGEKESADTRQKKIDAAKWRIREADRTHQIIKELEKAGPSDVMLLGDMNDSVGLDEYEPEAGGDGIAHLVGPASDGLILASKPLADAHQNSFNGYWRDRYRELIDHVVITPSMKDKVVDVKVFQDAMTAVSSDHFPVMVKVKTK